MADELDSLVKGAPQTSKDVSGITSTTPIHTPATGKQGDPLSHAPSAPSMIYLNLLILEASLRLQYLELRARRRHHTFFLALLSLWIAGFAWLLFLHPREDGQGVGGSVYWGVEVVEKVCLMGGVITAVLVWGTGIWDRGIRWPRRWFGISNRGLRGFNCKLVVIRNSWWAELASTLAFFLTYGLLSRSASSSYRYVDPAILREVDKELNLTNDGHPTLPMLGEDEERGGREEDISPGGDYVKLLLLAKPFSPTFRENWELYRTEYWEKENERRASIRARIRARDKGYATGRWGSFWWLPWHRAETDRHFSRERTPQLRVEREHRHRGNSVRRGSTSSSRSQTPTIELEEVEKVTRKASTASNASDKRRKKLSSGSRTQKRPESRSVTPDMPSPLARESSIGSTSGSGAGGGRTLRNSTSRASIGSPKEKPR